MPSGGEGPGGLTPRVSNPLQSFSLHIALPGNELVPGETLLDLQTPALVLVASETEALRMELRATFSIRYPPMVTKAGWPRSGQSLGFRVVRPQNRPACRSHGATGYR